MDKPKTPTKPATPVQATPKPVPVKPTPTTTPDLVWPVDLRQVQLGPRYLGFGPPPFPPGYRVGYGFHTGLDFLCPVGVRVFAMADGVVTDSSPTASARGYGNQVVISHPQLGVSTRYAHLQSRLVKTGDWVKKGQLIGYVGMSGTDNPHLHFDVIAGTLPTPRFNPHNPATGGIENSTGKKNAEEKALTQKHFRDPLVYLNQHLALNPATGKVAAA